SDQPISIGAHNFSLHVPLGGSTALPKMCLSPALLDFHSQPVNVQAQQHFVISSCGQGALTVRGMQIAAGSSFDFALVSPPGVPLVLPAGTAANVTVGFTPSTTAGSVGRVDVYSNDPALPSGSVD